MNNVIVNKSVSINPIDVVKIKNDVTIFNIDEKNDTQQDLIILYMYILPKFQAHGVKVGMTKCKIGETFWHAIKSRIRDQVHELALSDEDYSAYGLEREVVYWGICLDAHNESFKDYVIHDLLKEKLIGIMEKQQEWFLGVPTNKIIDFFQSFRNKDLNKKIYNPRDEQRECVDSLLDYFNTKKTGGRFLLNCKMRFGKCYTVYKYCEEANIDKVLILTFIPAVEESWKEDLSHIQKEYDYYTDNNIKNPSFEPQNIDTPFVLFLSLQNYLGKDRNSTDTKEKIKKLQGVDWDLVVLDEYHFGAWNEKTQGTLESQEDLDVDYQKELKKTKDVIEAFQINTKQTICLSGTPFKAIAKGEFTKENTYTYSYFDEQRNKYPNSESGDFNTINPDYEHFPDMKIFGYNMKRLFANMTADVFSGDKLYGKTNFSLNKFFETKKDRNPSEPCEFIYEEEIKKWLLIIQGKSTFGDKFPYSNIDMLKNNKHTLWLLPKVNAVHAMAKLLENDDYFKKFEIINLSAEGVGTGVNAFKYLNKEITKSNNTTKVGSIALTVNKLTIGVTVPEWFSVFVLKDLASPEQYFQSIFRIQTPFKNKEGNILKKQGFVYDFNIDRAASLLLKYAEQSAEGSVTKLQIAKLIVKYLPIFINGDMTTPISEGVFYELAEFGDTSGVPLSRKITDTSKTTRLLDDDVIAAMLNDNEVSDIIKRVFAHAKFNKPKDTTMTQKPDIDGFETKIAKEGRDKGNQIGIQDSNNYVDYDNTEIQEAFESAVEKYISTICPSEYSNEQKVWWSNGFIKGYEGGVNAPIKKMKCGYEDGIKFIRIIKDNFNENIQWTNATKKQLTDFIHKYLNDINNIPNQYRGALYSRWYKESFKAAIRIELSPPKQYEKGESIEDADNVLKHILSRLFEFLYISVYRETTFLEIFANADENVFLEAVGITKKDFEVLNKYHVFQEVVLNNYIHQFFVNESLGSKLNLEDEEIKRQYRNSFDWFGFGIENEKGLDLPVVCSAKEVIVEKPIEESKEQDKKTTEEDFVFDVEVESEDTSPEENYSSDVKIIERSTPKPRYYLAYGSNLNPQQMQTRCPEAKRVGKAIIKDYRLMFKKSGTGYYLTIEKAFGYNVPVGVFIVSQTDESELDRREGCPVFYYKKDIKVELQQDEGGVVTIDAFVYILHEDRELGSPTNEYVNRVLVGYDYFDFDKKLIEEAIAYSKNSVIEDKYEEKSDLDKIKFVLKSNPSGLNASKIAEKCGLSKGQVNSILNTNKELFRNTFFIWKLK